MTDSLSKTKSSFYRRLYVAYLIDQGVSSVPALMSTCDMPRRTAQDTIASLAELDIECQFQPTQGERHNSGEYRIISWGPIDPAWVKKQAKTLADALGYPAIAV